jgi:hypothetical protein
MTIEEIEKFHKAPNRLDEEIKKPGEITIPGDLA